MVLRRLDRRTIRKMDQDWHVVRSRPACKRTPPPNTTPWLAAQSVLSCMLNDCLCVGVARNDPLVSIEPFMNRGAYPTSTNGFTTGNGSDCFTTIGSCQTLECELMFVVASGVELPARNPSRE